MGKDYLFSLCAQVFLERDAAEVSRLRALLVATAARHPRGFRNATWPAGLRADPGLAPPPPQSRSLPLFLSFPLSLSLLRERDISHGDTTSSVRMSSSRKCRHLIMAFREYFFRLSKKPPVIDFI